jgi:hypothetical protein
VIKGVGEKQPIVGNNRGTGIESRRNLTPSPSPFGAVDYPKVL